MPTRYQVLRRTVVNLASPAEDQVEYLDRSFASLTGGGSAAGYGNDELALEFDDSYIAVGHMCEYGEISQREIEVLRPLDALLDRWSGQSNADFWRREALFTDPRWAEVRDCAAQALAHLPDELRESEYTRSLSA